MIAHEMVDRAVSVRQVAAQLGVDESTLRYRLGRPLDAPDGRAARATALTGWDARVDAVLTRFGDDRVVTGGMGHCEAQMLHGLLHLLGLDHEKLSFPYAGREFKLTDLKGTVVKEIVA